MTSEGIGGKTLSISISRKTPRYLVRSIAVTIQSISVTPLDPGEQWPCLRRRLERERAGRRGFIRGMVELSLSLAAAREGLLVANREARRADASSDPCGIDRGHARGTASAARSDLLARRAGGALCPDRRRGRLLRASAQSALAGPPLGPVRRLGVRHPHQARSRSPGGRPARGTRTVPVETCRTPPQLEHPSAAVEPRCPGYTGARHDASTC